MTNQKGAFHFYYCTPCVAILWADRQENVVIFATAATTLYAAYLAFYCRIVTIKRGTK